MIATEAAAEGINLQFCSLVINYDLPWNPQRIEQRIGRCNRYGQKHDVVVVNFLNKKNAGDQRVSPPWEWRTFSPRPVQRSIPLKSVPPPDSVVGILHSNWLNSRSASSFAR